MGCDLLRHSRRDAGWSYNSLDQCALEYPSSLGQYFNHDGPLFYQPSNYGAPEYSSFRREHDLFASGRASLPQSFHVAGGHVYSVGSDFSFALSFFDVTKGFGDSGHRRESANGQSTRRWRESTDSFWNFFEQWSGSPCRGALCSKPRFC